LHEFEHTLLKILAKHGMSLSDLAKTAGYNPLFLTSIASGKNRKVPVDFFIRISEALELDNEEKDELVRSWAFGVERWY
jgi:DNA-binding Xre family transcriptional regulator